MNPFQALFSGVNDQQVNNGLAWATPRLQQASQFVQQKVGNKNKRAGEAMGRINSLFTGASNMLQGGQGFSQNLRNIGNLGMSALGQLGSVISSFSSGGASKGFEAIGNAVTGLFNEGKEVYNGLGYADGRNTMMGKEYKKQEWDKGLGAPKTGLPNDPHPSNHNPAMWNQGVPTPPPLPSNGGARPNASPSMDGGLQDSIQGFDQSRLRHVDQNRTPAVDTASQIRGYDKSNLRTTQNGPRKEYGVNQTSVDEDLRRKRQQMGLGVL